MGTQIANLHFRLGSLLYEEIPGKWSDETCPSGEIAFRVVNHGRGKFWYLGKSLTVNRGLDNVD